MFSTQYLGTKLSDSVLRRKGTVIFINENSAIRYESVKKGLKTYSLSSLKELAPQTIILPFLAEGSPLPAIRYPDSEGDFSISPFAYCIGVCFSFQFTSAASNHQYSKIVDVIISEERTHKIEMSTKETLRI